MDNDNSTKNARVRLSLAVIVAIIFVLAIIALPVWYWYWWRIEPGNSELAVLIRKTGNPLPANEILATSERQRGIQLEVLPEGRHFRNPYTWDWKIHSMTDIPAGKLGVKVRLYGKNPEPGEILASEGYKGIEPEVLAPGKYRINPYAYDVIVLDAIHIRPGNVGVKTSLVGKDLLNSNSNSTSADPDAYLVNTGDKGVYPEVLNPGTYYLNPYIWAVVEVNLQSQRFEMSGDEVIQFLTADGFSVRVEGTIEFNIQRDMAALLIHKVGDMEDIVKKLIMPRARGFVRIEGSKKTAVEFIVGETRQQFQNNLEKHLNLTCADSGVAVNSVLIRNIIPPNEIATIIRNRELAGQEIKKIEQQITQAKSRAELVKQEMLALRNRAEVEAETAKIRAEISARQRQEVKKTAATRELEVTKINKDTATARVKAKLLVAGAERDIIKMRNEAEAEVLRTKIAAFGDGLAWAHYNLYQKLAPQIKSIMTSDSSTGTWLPVNNATTSSKEASQ